MAQFYTSSDLIWVLQPRCPTVMFKMNSRFEHCSPLLIWPKHCNSEFPPQSWKGTFEARQRKLLKMNQIELSMLLDPKTCLLKSCHFFDNSTHGHWLLCAVMANHTTILISPFVLLCTNNLLLLFPIHVHDWELACKGITVWMQLTGYCIPRPTGLFSTLFHLTMTVVIHE